MEGYQDKKVVIIGGTSGMGLPSDFRVDITLTDREVKQRTWRVPAKVPGVPKPWQRLSGKTRKRGDFYKQHLSL